MSTSSLLAVSPIDGRYSAQVQSLVPYFSEFALIKYRVKVEVEYLIQLSDLNLKNCPPISESGKTLLLNYALNFSEAEAGKVKLIEKQINHDVKAVEYDLKEKLESEGLNTWIEFVHFGLTSQDINNTAIPLMVRDCHHQILEPQITGLIKELTQLGNKWKNVPMLARTHGQPATPTRFGKEILVFVERLERQLELLSQIPFMAKFGGATGGFNAHHIAYPDVNWVEFGNQFVERLGLQRSKYTTQIEHYDCLAAYFDGWARVNTILLDFTKDIWHYISMDYLRQKIKSDEVGSSAMPHKVNPIDFENAEGNLGISNALFHHFSTKLPISRLQRDLSDSTVLRNIGVPIGHSIIAWSSISKGIKKLEINQDKMLEELKNHPEVITEAIQTILRREGYPKPYEALKQLSRISRTFTMMDISNFIEQLEINEDVKAELKLLRPETFLGQLPD